MAGRLLNAFSNEDGGEGRSENGTCVWIRRAKEGFVPSLMGCGGDGSEVESVEKSLESWYSRIG